MKSKLTLGCIFLILLISSEIVTINAVVSTKKSLLTRQRKIVKKIDAALEQKFKKTDFRKNFYIDMHASLNAGMLTQDWYSQAEKDAIKAGTQTSGADFKTAASTSAGITFKVCGQYKTDKSEESGDFEYDNAIDDIDFKDATKPANQVTYSETYADKWDKLLPQNSFDSLTSYDNPSDNVPLLGTKEVFDWSYGFDTPTKDGILIAFVGVLVKHLLIAFAKSVIVNLLKETALAAFLAVVPVVGWVILACKWLYNLLSSKHSFTVEKMKKDSGLRKHTVFKFKYDYSIATGVKIGLTLQMSLSKVGAFVGNALKLYSDVKGYVAKIATAIVNVCKKGLTLVKNYIIKKHKNSQGWFELVEEADEFPDESILSRRFKKTDIRKLLHKSRRVKKL